MISDPGHGTDAAARWPHVQKLAVCVAATVNSVDHPTVGALAGVAVSTAPCGSRANCDASRVSRTAIRVYGSTGSGKFGFGWCPGAAEARRKTSAQSRGRDDDDGDVETHRAGVGHMPGGATSAAPAAHIRTPRFLDRCRLRRRNASNSNFVYFIIFTGPSGKDHPPQSSLDFALRGARIPYKSGLPDPCPRVPVKRYAASRGGGAGRLTAIRVIYHTLYLPLASPHVCWKRPMARRCKPTCSICPATRMQPPGRQAQARGAQPRHPARRSSEHEG